MLKDCDLSINTLSSMQSGGYFPRLEAIAKIADYLNVSIDYLLGREDSDIGKSSLEQDTKKEPVPEVRDKLDEDIWNAITQIPDEKREEALRYLQYLASQSEQ